MKALYKDYPGSPIRGYETRTLFLLQTGAGAFTHAAYPHSNQFNVFCHTDNTAHPNHS
jgi:hypothetical protein